MVDADATAYVWFICRMYVCKQKPDIYTVASAPALAIPVFNRRFRLFLAQCTVCTVYTVYTLYTLCIGVTIALPTKQKRKRLGIDSLSLFLMPPVHKVTLRTSYRILANLKRKCKKSYLFFML